MIDVQEANKENVRQWNINMLDAYEDEPDVFHALNAECYNAATKALGHKGAEYYKEISWWQRRFRHWIRYSPKDFQLQDAKQQV